MSETILDLASDTNGAELNRLSLLYAFPDFAKQASADDLFPEGVAPSAYADPVNKLYPCHNAASTWFSALYFKEKSAEYHPKIAAKVKQRLDGLVNYWGLKAAVDAIDARYDELYKNAEDRLPDSDFGYVWVGEDGTKQRFCRMKSAAETKAAAEWLLEYRDTMPYADRNVIAGKILEKAAHFGVGLGTDLELFVERQAGQGVCEPKEVVAMIRQRAHLTKAAAQRDQIISLANTIQQSPRFALQPAQLVKLAEVMDDVDRTLNLVGRYTDTIQRPEDVIFRVTYKEATAGIGSACALSTGKVYDRQAFKKIALDDIAALMGADFAKEVQAGLEVDVEKLAELAETMPRDDAALFEQLLTEAGVPPIHNKTAGDRYGLRGAAALEPIAMGY